MNKLQILMILQARKAIHETLVHAKLKVAEVSSTNGADTYLLIGASEDRLEFEAEQIEKMKKLKVRKIKFENTI